MSRQTIYLILLHIGLGAAGALSSVVSTIWLYGCMLFFLNKILKSRNSDQIATLATAYLIGGEIYFRMTKASAFWEMGKYAVTIFMVLAMFLENRQNRKIPKAPVFYFILLLPSIIMVDFNGPRWDELISFNLSGPLVLMVSALYFYQRKFDVEMLKKMFFYMILPIISMVLVIMVRMPKLEDITFTLSSNKATSGGIGPNQVSFELGLGFLVLGIAWLLKIKILGTSVADRVTSFVFLGYAIMSFSRGGVLVPLLTVFLGFLVATLHSGSVKEFGRMVFVLIFIGVAGYGMWIYLNTLTGGKLAARYEKTVKKTVEGGEQYLDVQTEDVNFSGRQNIADADLAIFMNSPILGVGPGNATDIRLVMIGHDVVAHTEYTRLLAEHGVYGIFSLLILVLFPLQLFKTSKTKEAKVVSACFMFFALITFSHIAMRMAAPCYLYGLAFVSFAAVKNPLQRSESDYIMELEPKPLHLRVNPV